MIHACDVPVPVWAVPVLAATCTPGMAMAVAVPPLTTPTIRSRSVEATAGGTAVRHGLGFALRTMLPSLSRTSFMT